MTSIGPLLASLKLSGLSGSLKYLNLSTNKIQAEDESFKVKLCALLRLARGLQVLRLHKTWIHAVTKDEATHLKQIELSQAIVDALCESESAPHLKAIEIMMPTVMTWTSAYRLEKSLPKLESLDIYCLGIVRADDRVEIDAFLAHFAAKGKRASCQQIV